MNGFRTRYYHITNKKFSGTFLRFAFLSDLHGICLGTDNEDLITEIRKAKPEMILIGGDMLNRFDPESFQTAEKFLCVIAEEFPVYYVLGNHEFVLSINQDESYLELERRLTEAGIHFIHNDKMILKKKDCRICIHGLELPLDYYRKPFPKILKKEFLTSVLGNKEHDMFHILIAHNPLYGKKYLKWGADLILSGHYHGGLVRFGENTGLVSSFGHPFPGFCCGRFEYGEQTMLVSPGLGEHSVSIRICNPRELFIVECDALKKGEKRWQSL